MNRSSFEEIIERDGRLIYTNVGDSMEPLIREGRDLLVIEKPSGRLKRYDIPLYKRDNGKYVLHRVLKVRDEDYVICGDDRYTPEYGITDRNVIGVLTALITDGKERKLEGKRYGIYVFFWCRLFPLRALFLRMKHYFKRLTGRRG